MRDLSNKGKICYEFSDCYNKKGMELSLSNRGTGGTNHNK